MPQQFRTLHILLVDNDAQVRAKVQQALGNGFHLHHVRSPEEAQYVLAKFVPDLLICEVVFPAASGLDFCHVIRHSTTLNHLPIMLLTTLSTLQDKVAGFDAGADDYVVKPFDPHYLTTRVRLLSRIKRLESKRD